MSKAADMAKVSVKGGFHLLWGLVASTIIAAVSTIIIASLLGDTEYGQYAIALTAPNLIAIFRDWGINSAMIKYTAQYNAENKASDVRSVFVSGLVFEITLGLALSVLCFFLSDFLAAGLFKRPAIVPLIQVASLIILAGALQNAATAAFTGIEKLHLNSIMLVFQSIIKAILVPALLILGLRTFGAIAGTTATYLIAGLIGVLLIWTIYRSLPKILNGSLKIFSNIKVLFKYGLPLSLGSMIAGLLAQFYAFLMAIYVSNDAMIGSYSIANYFVVLISFFATPVTTMLFPAFSKLNPQKDQETLKNVFQFSVKYTTLLVVPVTAMIIALSQPAISTLFGNRYVEAPLFLSLLAISYLYSALGNLSAGALINGQGHTTLYLALAAITAAIGFPTGWMLISHLGIFGLILASLTVGIPSLIISLHWLKNRYTVTVDWASSAKILLSSAAAATITYALETQLTFASWIQLIIGVTIFSLTFVTAILLTRAINHTDISNLREMLSSLGPLHPLFNSFLNLIEKLMNILKL